MADVHFVPLSSYNWSLGNFDYLQWNPTVYCLVASFFAVSLWLALELTVQVYTTFKRRTGLYFWSILIVACGIAFHTIGLLLKLFVPRVNVIFATTLAKVGWVMDTTGFAVVLYSRLHLVVQSQKTLRRVLTMIIVDAVVFHTPIIVFLLGLSLRKDWDRYVAPFEYTQVVGFSIQETVISCIYITKTIKFLKSGYSDQLRNVTTMLIAVQVLVVIVDVALLIIDCIGMFTLKAILHPFAYGIKLKIEFAVLNLLLNLVKHGGPTGNFFEALDDNGDRDPASNPPTGKAPARWSWARNTPDHNERRSNTVKNNIVRRLEFDVTWQDTMRSNTVTTVLPLHRPHLAAVGPNIMTLDSGSTLQDSLLEEAEDNSIEDVERQYLGNFGLQRP